MPAILSAVPQNLGGVFGTGSDGPLLFDGTSTVAGLVPSGSVYTMTRDLQATSLTVSNGVTIKTANFRIFCQGVLTNLGTISNAGLPASGSSAGGSGGSASLLGGRAGGAGGTGASGAGANGTGSNFGAVGGNGGAGTSGAAGTGGSVTVSAAVAQNNLLQTPGMLLTGVAGYGGLALVAGFGAGGGGGGSDAGSNAGGGGGGGGGIVAIFAWAVNNAAGTITVAGGNGAAAAAGNAGGGGGGTGGLVAVYTLSAWTAGTVTVAGGALGAGHGTGANGTAGASGLSLNVVLE